MDTMFENLDFRFDKENNDERPFIIACKDREIIDGERWVLASLSTDEAKRLLKYLEEHADNGSFFFIFSGTRVTGSDAKLVSGKLPGVKI